MAQRCSLSCVVILFVWVSTVGLMDGYDLDWQVTLRLHHYPALVVGEDEDGWLLHRECPVLLCQFFASLQRL
jgi:hypothetical protein